MTLLTKVGEKNTLSISRRESTPTRDDINTLMHTTIIKNISIIKSNFI